MPGSTGVNSPDDAPGQTAEIYWRPGCPYCSALRRDLARQGVAATWRNIWEDDQARAFVRSVNHGNETVPTVRIGTRTFTNPTGSQVSLLLHGDRTQSGDLAIRGRLSARWVASWLPTIGLVVTSAIVARQGLLSLSWGIGLLAVAAWWRTRPLRR